MKNNSIYKSDTGRSLIINHYDNLLKACPVDKETILVNTSFGKTFVIASGRGDTPLILLHGSSTNSAMWLGDGVKICHLSAEKSKKAGFISYIRHNSCENFLFI